LEIPTDIFLQIEQDVIHEVMSIENLAIQIDQEVTTEVNTVISNVANEFNNVITPALNQVGQEIGQGLSLAGGDILQGLKVAGQYIENYPELIAEIFLTIAIVRVPQRSTNS
jgi:phage-related protein